MPQAEVPSSHYGVKLLPCIPASTEIRQRAGNGNLPSFSQPPPFSPGLGGEVTPYKGKVQIVSRLTSSFHHRARTSCAVDEASLLYANKKKLSSPPLLPCSSRTLNRNTQKITKGNEATNMQQRTGCKRVGKYRRKDKNTNIIKVTPHIPMAKAKEVGNGSLTGAKDTNGKARYLSNRSRSQRTAVSFPCFPWDGSQFPFCHHLSINSTVCA